MGYLICNKCGSYYKLQPGETVEDFILECECGGVLKYKVTMPTPNNENHIKHSEVDGGINDVWNKSTNIKVISVIGVCLVGFILIGAVMGVFNPNKSTFVTPDVPISNNSSTSTVHAGSIEINGLALKEIPQYKKNPLTGKDDYSHPEQFSMYELNGELVPSSDFNYLGLAVTYYDSQGKVISKNSIWSMNGVKKGEKYVIRAGQNLTGVSKASIIVSTSQDPIDESKVIFKKDLMVYGK